MLSDQDIFNRYIEKKSEFEKRAPVSLLGHSLFDMWGDYEPSLHLKNLPVANLGLSGTSTRQYLDVIASPQHIEHLGDAVFFFLGVNDIVKEPDYSPQQVLDWSVRIMQCIREKGSLSTRYFFLEATPVNNRGNVTNKEIQAMNAYFKKHCPADLIFVPTYDKFLNEKGNLRIEFTIDGLHFNEAGYAVLREILEGYL